MCPQCFGRGYRRKTKTPKWRCRKCAHEWDVLPGWEDRHPGVISANSGTRVYPPPCLQCRTTDMWRFTPNRLRREPIWDCMCGMSNYSEGLPNEIRMPKPDPLGPNGPFAIIGSPVGAGGLFLVILLFLFLVIPLCADK